jgi:hypothetical protein
MELMPKQVDVDWQLAEGLYQQGLSCAEIARRLTCNASTVRTKALRGKWSEKKAQALEILKQSVADEPLDVKKHADQWARDLMQVCQNHMDYLKEVKPGKLTPKDVQLGAQVLRIIDDVARRTLGLDSEQPKIQHVGLVQNVVEIKWPVPQPESLPAPAQNPDAA